MDSAANIDGMQWFMDAVWPLLAADMPAARVTVVGRNPNAKLMQAAKERGLPWSFTGFVEDVRPYVHEAAAYVIPLRVGGGTRIKAYEAMALGRPVVSTLIGVEGLSLEPGQHYLLADTAEAFARSVVQLLRDGALRLRLAAAARHLVEQNFSAGRAAEVFEAICVAALARARPPASQSAG
jgi:glycosyltransferase involved in cell wall biosynthesis